MNQEMEPGLELIPGALSMHVLAHEVAAGEAIPCWSFVSEGLAALGQREVVLTLKTREDDEPEAAAGEAGRMFCSLYHLAGEGRLVDAGGFSILGEGTTLFGRRGFVYADVHALDELGLPEGALAAHLVTAEEAAVAQELSVVRLLGRLGRQTRFFPWPCWSDRDRAPVAALDEDSVLAKMPRLRVPGMEVFMLEGRVVLSLTRAGASEMAAALEELPDETAFALTGTPHIGGECSLVWSPGQAVADGIAAGDRPFRVSGAFLGFAPKVEKDAKTQAEDGFVVMLTAASWARFREALGAGERLSLLDGDFELMLRPDEEASDRAETIIFEEPDELIRQRCGAAQLMDVLKAAVAGAAPGSSLRLVLEPPGSVRVLEGPKGLQAALPPVLVREGPVHVRLEIKGS